MRSIVYTYRISLDREGYVILDSEGEPVEAARYRTMSAAEEALSDMLDEDIEAKRQELDDADDHE